MTDKLFRVTTVVKEYDGRKDVAFHWFYDGKRTPPRPYAELVKNYDPTDRNASYSEDCIDEMFTEDEANQLVAYLNRTHGDDGPHIIEEEKLPIANNMMGLGAIAVGGGDDFYMLYNAPEYPLPFKVLGYFDLRECSLTDKQQGLETKRWEIRRLIQEVEDERLDAALAALTNAADQIPTF